MFVYVFLWIYAFVSLGYISGSRASGSYGSSIYNNFWKCQLFPRVAAPFYIITGNVWGLQFFRVRTRLATVLLIVTVPAGGKWYFIILLIYLSLMVG